MEIPEPTAIEVALLLAKQANVQAQEVVDTIRVYIDGKVLGVPLTADQLASLLITAVDQSQELKTLANDVKVELLKI